MLSKQAGHCHKTVVLHFILTFSAIFSSFTNSARLDPVLGGIRGQFDRCYLRTEMSPGKMAFDVGSWLSQARSMGTVLLCLWRKSRRCFLAFTMSAQHGWCEEPTFRGSVQVL